MWQLPAQKHPALTKDRKWMLKNVNLTQVSFPTPPPPPGNEYLEVVESWRTVTLRFPIFNCHFPSPLEKWTVSIFGTFKSSWTSDFKVSLYPVPSTPLRPLPSLRKWTASSGGSRGGHASLLPPPLAQIFFIFMQFSEKKLPNNRLVPPLWG